MFKSFHFTPAQVENLVQQAGIFVGGFAVAHGIGTNQEWQSASGLIVAILVWWFSHHAPPVPPTTPPNP
jgi:hypothetical protein